MPRNFFCTPRNWIYSLQNDFFSYAYIKHINKTLKWIGKIQFVLELTILLNLYISKFHGSLCKEKLWNYQSLNTTPYERKVNFSVIYPTHFIIYSFWRTMFKEFVNDRDKLHFNSKKYRWLDFLNFLCLYHCDSFEARD